MGKGTLAILSALAEDKQKRIIKLANDDGEDARDNDVAFDYFLLKDIRLLFDGNETFYADDGQ